MPDAITSFLDQAGARLAALDAQLAKAATARDVAWAICEFTGQELELSDCVVYLPDGEDGLIQHAAWGPKRAGNQILESRIQLAIGKGVVGDCARRRTPQRVDDTRRDIRYVADDQVNLSELAVPLIHDDVLLGVLDSEHPETAFYDNRHVQAFQAIAERAAARLAQLRG